MPFAAQRILCLILAPVAVLLWTERVTGYSDVTPKLGYVWWGHYSTGRANGESSRMNVL